MGVEIDLAIYVLPDRHEQPRQRRRQRDDGDVIRRPASAWQSGADMPPLEIDPVYLFAARTGPSSAARSRPDTPAAAVAAGFRTRKRPGRQKCKSGIISDC